MCEAKIPMPARQVANRYNLVGNENDFMVSSFCLKKRESDSNRLDGLAVADEMMILPSILQSP
jgi:hypothetical protein